MDFWSFWDSIFVQPLTDGLVYLYQATGNYGWSIILFTLAIKLLTMPLTWKQLQSSKAMQKLQPQLQELRKKYGSNREEFAREQMKLWQDAGINPMLGCLPLVIQMPVWFALYQALINLSTQGSEHYDAFARPFLFVPNLGQIPTFVDWWAWVLAILSAVTQWLITRMMMTRTTDPQQQMMNTMMNFMPLMFAYITFQVPAGLAVYWVVSNVFTFFQQYALMGWGSLFPEEWGLGDRGLIPNRNPKAPVLPAKSTSRANGSATTQADGAQSLVERPSRDRKASESRHADRRSEPATSDWESFTAPRGEAIGSSGLVAYDVPSDGSENAYEPDEPGERPKPGEQRPRGSKRKKKR